MAAAAARNVKLDASSLSRRCEGAGCAKWPLYGNEVRGGGGRLVRTMDVSVPASEHSGIGRWGTQNFHGSETGCRTGKLTL